MDTESQWTYNRMRLYKLRRKHPDWTQKQLATALGYSLSWVKKWLRRFREAVEITLEVFTSRSRAPKNPFRKVTERVRDVILYLRQSLPESYGRVVGPEPILYHLHHDDYFSDDDDESLPTSPTTIYTVLKEAGYMPEKLRYHEPLERVPPMSEWEFDFADVKIAEDAYFEIAPIIDRGTSIAIAIPFKQGNYQAHTALEMLIEVFKEHGYPPRFRFDRDPRLVGPAGMDGYPSALMRFAWCIGMEPVPCPPGRPDKKPFIERFIRTVKYEGIYVHKPANGKAFGECVDIFQGFYNHERAHQGFSCKNQPPMVAHTDLPALQTVPMRVNPDAWVDAYHGEMFKRQVSSTGAITIDNHHYQVGRQYALKTAAVHLNARDRVFQITVGPDQLPARPIKGLHERFMDFDEYAETIIEEARAEARRLRMTT